MSPQQKLMKVVTNANLARSPKHVENRDWVIVTIAGVVFWLWVTIWWAGFAPAVMTPDSIDQWRQTMTGQYGNEHPFLHTLTVAFMRKIWNSPGSMVFLQTMLCSLAFGLSLRAISRHHRGAAMGYAAIFFFFPIFGIYSVTVWKDILFSIGFFLFSILWIDRGLLDYCVDMSWKRAAATGIVIAYFASLRHNGVVLAALIPVIVLLRSDLKRTSRIALATSVAISYLFAQTVLLQLMHISSARMPYGRELPVVQLISAVVANNGLVTPDERIVITSLSPINQIASRYNCYISTSVIMSNPYFNSAILYDSTFDKMFNNTAAHVLARNLPIVVGDRACLTMHMLGLGPPNLAYLYETAITPNSLGLTPNPVWNLRNPLLAYLAWSERYPQRLLFWDYVPCLAMIIFAWRTCKSGAVRDIAILLLVTTAVMCLFGPARDYRYLFPLALISPFLFFYATGSSRQHQVIS